MQGGGASLPNYKSQQLPVIRAFETNGIPAVLCHASKIKRKIKRWVSGFSDDILLFINEIGVRMSGIDEDLPIAQRVRNAVQGNLERYEEYFFTAGGSLNLKKCFYYFIGFTWTGTKWRYQENDEMGVEQISVKPTTLHMESEEQRIKWYAANDAQRTLGSYIAPDGSSTTQLEVIRGKLQDWLSCLKNMNQSNLTAKWLSYKTVFLRKIMYPMIGHSCNREALSELQRPVDKEVLHILGLNEHFPRAMLYAPWKLGGMGCTSIHGQHLIDKILLFIHHLRENGQIGETLAVSMSSTQLECGSTTPFFSLDANKWGHLVTETWTTHIWRECQPLGIGIKFHPECYWVPKPVREGDVAIMEVAETMYAGLQLQQINMCRIALKVTFLSDISSVDGKRILLSYYNGKPHVESGRRPRLNWPPIGEIPKTWWKLWQAFLEQWCGTALLLSNPLGRWYAGAEMLTQCCCFLYENRLVMQHKNGFYEFEPYTARSRTRFKLQAHSFDEIHLLQRAKVVDIVYRSQSIFIIAQSEQRVIPEGATQAEVSLHNIYHNLSPELQRIIGKVEWPDYNSLVDIAEAIDGGTAIGVSDGSVRTSSDSATHAWIIQAANGSEICGSGPVDGTSEARTSHRAELQGGTALLLIVSMIAKFFQITKGKISMYCDNQAVVKKVQNGWSCWRYRHTKGPDGDFQAVARHVTQQIQSEHKISVDMEWVKGHQDNANEQTALTRQAALNVRMDKAASKAYDLTSNWRTIQFMPVLKAEVCAVYVGNDKITTNIHLCLADQWHEKEARAYLLQRHDITPEIFPTVQWQSLRYALKKLSAHRRATAVKALHRHLPTQEKLFQQGRVTMSSLCPRCMKTAENNSHVYCCSNEDAFNQRKVDWMEMWKQMTKSRTASIIEQTWRYYLQPILKIPLGSSIIEGLVIAHGEVADLLSIAISEQTTIGWEKLLLGLGSTTWAKIQEVIDAANPKAPKRSATAWMNSAIHQLIKFSLRCWKARNSKIHGATMKEQHDISLQQARDRIKAIYAEPPTLAPRFRSIFEVPLEHRLKMSLQAAEQWISLINHQAMVTQHNFKCLIRQHKSMKAHLRTMRREARAQAKERQLPVTPRKAHRREVQAAVKAMKDKLYQKRRGLAVQNSRGRKLKTSRIEDSNLQRGDIACCNTKLTVSAQRPPLRHHPP